MSSEAPELPGFYFDPEKNRYFRIVPGQARASSSNHSMPSSAAQTFVCDDVMKENSSSNICQLITNRTRASRWICGRQFQLDALYGRFKLLGKISEDEAVYFSNGSDQFLRPCHSQDLALKVSSDCSQILCKRKIDNHNVLLAINDVQCSAATVTEQAIRWAPRICDFTFLTFAETGQGVLGTSIYQYNESKVFLWTNLSGLVCTKLVDGTPWACASRRSTNVLNEHCISYSSESKTCLVKSTEKHFANKRASSKFVDVLKLPSRVSSHHFSHDLHFSGMDNGGVVAYDWRVKPTRTLSFHAGGRRVSRINALNNRTGIITRQLSSRDIICLWDIRRLNKPVLRFIDTDAERSTVHDGGFHVDENEMLLSATTSDGVFRIWSISNGRLMCELDHEKCCQNSPLYSGMYASAWRLFDSKPGIVGLCKNRLCWLPLI